MKILVTGVAGQLGYDVVKELNSRGIECLGVDKSDFDITDYQATKKFIVKYHPDVVIHCAAYTAVDAAEDNAELCCKVNADGTKNIAMVCAILGIAILYISTDYVFLGLGEDFYEVDSHPLPCNVYGRSKMAGEVAVESMPDKYFIVRSSWIFGHHGNNFVKTMLRLGKEKSEIRVVNDQIGSPTYTIDLAKLLCDIAVSDKYGIYHATNEGICSWAEFAAEIMKVANLPCKVIPISSEEYPTRAIRPKNSRLSKKSLDENGFARLPNWKDALRRFLSENTSN